jgi:hypothetical protein
MSIVIVLKACPPISSRIPKIRSELNNQGALHPRPGALFLVTYMTLLWSDCHSTGCHRYLPEVRLVSKGGVGAAAIPRKLGIGGRQRVSRTAELTTVLFEGRLINGVAVIRNLPKCGQPIWGILPCTRQARLRQPMPGSL